MRPELQRSYIMKGFFKSRLVLTLAMLILLAGALAVSLAGITPSRAEAAASIPSGDRIHGQSTIEPVYDDTTGNLNFVMTPNKAPNPVNSNPKSWAPFYVPVYPLSASASVGTLQCAHLPADNCPDHGPPIAGAAASIVPSVYASRLFVHTPLISPPERSVP